MPQYAQISGRALLLSEGLLLPVRIDVPSSVSLLPRLAGATRTDASAGRALVDTGAEVTCIRREVLKELGAFRLRWTIAQTPGGRVRQGVYLVSFAVPDLELNLDSIRIPEVNLDGYPDDVIAIIGRDLLSRWHFAWHGPDGAWSVST
jgi:predicted aspartyl protease